MSEFSPLNRVLLVVGLLICAQACTTTLPQENASKPSDLSEPLAVSPVVLKPAVVEVAAVGDIMLGTDFPKNHLPPDSGRGLLADIAPALGSADITFGNLEGVLLDGGEPVKECKDPRACYLFRSPTEFAHTLAAAGFDVLSLANNHARDFGEPGRDSSMQALDAAGIRHSGREGDVASWTVNGVRVAVIAFAPFIGAHDFLDLEKAQSQVASLAQNHDIVIVSMHAGGEGQDVQHIPFAIEYYHGENRGDVVQFARAVIDVGADLVIGHGPHVPRAMELYRGRLVAYSLGNFSTYYGVSVEGDKGLAPVLFASLNAEGEFVSGQLLAARQRRPAGPQADASLEAIHRIVMLTRADFPLTPLRITPDGRIIRMFSPVSTSVSSKN